MDPRFWCSQEAQRCTPGSRVTRRQGPSSHVKSPRGKNAPGGANAQEHDLTIASLLSRWSKCIFRAAGFCKHEELAPRECVTQSH